MVVLLKLRLEHVVVVETVEIVEIVDTVDIVDIVDTGEIDVVVGVVELDGMVVDGMNDIVLEYVVMWWILGTESKYVEVGSCCCWGWLNLLARTVDADLILVVDVQRQSHIEDVDDTELVLWGGC